MKIFKYSKLDAVLLMLSITEFAVTITLATRWNDASIIGKLGSFGVLVLMMVYNIIVITHFFTHTPWFNSLKLNAVVSMLNSFNIGQSVKVYELNHVRNHHRFNNDQKGTDGKTKDTSSTFQQGEQGEHATLFTYAGVGAARSLINAMRELMSAPRLWRVGRHEHELLKLASRSPEKRKRELRQIALDRLACFLAVGVFLLISWQWTLICYLPAFYLALALANVQNYYEHYGAMPEHAAANSVSYYGKLYNYLAFNDGHHQEHHLRPTAHWTSLPEIRRSHSVELDQVERVVSPIPAILGFLDSKRVLLHKNGLAANSPEVVNYQTGAE